MRANPCRAPREHSAACSTISGNWNPVLFLKRCEAAARRDGGCARAAHGRETMRMGGCWEGGGGGGTRGLLR
jgi:hypothetical protein